jgi:hypothetical protein
MTRSVRQWTACLAECALDRAQPVLAHLLPDLQINLAQTLAATGIIPDRSTDLRPTFEAALGPQAQTVLNALSRLPFDDNACPATTFWRARFRDVPGADAFTLAFRGQPQPNPPAWAAPIIADADRYRDLVALVQRQRALALTRQDRSLYARFGWNDAGDVPGMTGLLNAAALLRTQRAWAIAAPHVDAAALESAAAHMAAAERSASLATLDRDIRRLGLPREQVAAALMPDRPVPPLAAILSEAATC